MSSRFDRASLLELLPHPAYRRHAKTGKFRDLNAAFALFVELQDAFPHRDRDGFHPLTLASFHQNVNLYHLWKCSSRYLTEQGATVLVANPRKLHAISRNERKCDRRDAQMLARLARVDAALLHPIQHGSAQAQHDLLGLKLRDALVRNRVSLINAIRFTLKSLGHPVRNPSSESFHKTVLADIPADCLPVVQPLLTVLAQVTEQIKAMERDLVRRSKQDYPATQRLQQIAGVGPLTALCFVLKVGDPQRFSRGRDVGAYLGLCPRRDQSGGTDKQLRISKCGDGLLRRLLVSAAHYVLGPFGPACALREHGQRLTGTGSAREKKRAVVAVARKLAVLLLSLWKHGTDYEPRVTTPRLVLTPA